ncbi:MAG: ABC transporter substrate-binding protein [Chloroflexota bacterium]|nr:ABC transporter substrate-binding protein [Chloroflexota bacterium]
MRLASGDAGYDRSRRMLFGSRFRWLTVLSLAVVLGLTLSACVPPGELQPGAGIPEDTTLKIALLPIMDVLPFHVAQTNGYFADEGISVEGVPVKSGQENATLMQTGQVDGQLTDLLGPVLFNQEEEKVKVVYTARRAYPDSPMFSIVAGPGGEIKASADLKGVPIGISQNTVIEYLTDRLLQAEGLSSEDIEITEVSAIPVRFELLMKGELPAAMLPDPLASGAIAAGATIVVDDSSHPELAQSVLAFTTEALADKPGTVASFVRAWDRAAAEINANPDAYKDLLIEVGRVPEMIQGSFGMPPFPEGSITSESEMQDVVDWMVGKGLIEQAVPYERLVDPGYLPL